MVAVMATADTLDVSLARERGVLMPLDRPQPGFAWGPRNAKQPPQNCLRSRNAGSGSGVLVADIVSCGQALHGDDVERADERWRRPDGHLWHARRETLRSGHRSQHRGSERPA